MYILHFVDLSCRYYIIQLVRQNNKLIWVLLHYTLYRTSQLFQYPGHAMTQQ